MSCDYLSDHILFFWINRRCFRLQVVVAAEAVDLAAVVAEAAVADRPGRQVEADHLAAGLPVAEHLFALVSFAHVLRVIFHNHCCP